MPQESLVQKKLIISARSPLGRWIAMLLVSALLLLFGMYLATDGGFFSKTIPGALGGPAQAAAKVTLDSISTSLKTYERQDLLFRYGAAIFVGFLFTGLLGRCIRSYRFQF